MAMVSSMAIKLEFGLAALTEDNEALLEIDALADILGMVSSAPEHLAGCLRVLAFKLRSEQNLCCLKALILVHIWLRDQDSTVHKSSLLELGPCMSQISAANPFLRMYALYIQDSLETSLWPPLQTTLNAFVQDFAMMDQRIEKLAQCWPGVVDAEPMAVAVDLLMEDTFRWYVYLRNGIDMLLCVTDRGDFSVEPLLDASFKCANRLLQFSGVAYSCTLQRESKLTGLLSHMVMENVANTIGLNVDTIVEQGVAGKLQQERQGVIDGLSLNKVQVQDCEQNVSHITSVQQGVGEELNLHTVSKGKEAMQGQGQEYGENASVTPSILELLQGLSIGQQNISRDLRDMSKEHKNVLQIMSKENKAFRKEMRSKLDKDGQKSLKYMEELGRNIGAYHEKLSRALLGRNVQDLLPICKELKVFLHFNSRRSITFLSLEEICGHLQLSVRELCTAKSFLVQELKREPIAKAVLTSFLKALANALHNFHGSKKEQWSTNSRKVELFGSEIMEMLKEASVNASEIIQRLNVMKDLLNCDHSSKLGIFQDSLDHVTTLFSISEVMRHVKRVDNIMKERWGLLVMFHLLTQKFRHPNLELDVCGSVERIKNLWHVGYGEIKTSDKVGLQKGIRQLKFIADVFEFLLNIAGGNKRYALDATKFLFIVHNSQDDVIPLSQLVDGIIQINISQLPY